MSSRLSDIGQSSPHGRHSSASCGCRATVVTMSHERRAREAWIQVRSLIHRAVLNDPGPDDRTHRSPDRAAWQHKAMDVRRTPWRTEDMGRDPSSLARLTSSFVGGVCDSGSSVHHPHSEERRTMAVAPEKFQGHLNSSLAGDSTRFWDGGGTGWSVRLSDQGPAPSRVPHR